MKKIWVLRYNDGTADVWDEEKGPPSWPYVDAFDVEGALKELISDYASLLTRHNALVEAVKRMMAADSPGVWNAKDYMEARAEVDRMIEEGE